MKNKHKFTKATQDFFWILFLIHTYINELEQCYKKQFAIIIILKGRIHLCILTKFDILYYTHAHNSQHCTIDFNIYQLPLEHYIRSLVFNFHAFWTNEYNFINIFRKKKIKKLETENVRRQIKTNKNILKIVWYTYRKC